MDLIIPIKRSEPFDDPAFRQRSRASPTWCDVLRLRPHHRSPWGLLLLRPGVTRDSFLGKLPVRCQGCGDASPLIGVLRASETPVRGVVYSGECRRREYICDYFGAARFVTAFRGS